jgi:hypothetical protein
MVRHSRKHAICLFRLPDTLSSEHCIDFLRQSAMCHGDIGLVTYSWHADQLMPVANATSHQCVNWNTLSSWMHDRAIDMMKPGWLMHPTLGTLQQNFCFPVRIVVVVASMLT